MSTEVELKAWVDRPDEIRRFLQENAHYKGSYVKEDTYFCRSSSGREQDRTLDRYELYKGVEEPLFRLREESGASVVTYKEKSRKEGVEINSEYEFSVTDPDAFGKFAEGIGFTPCITKRKEGELFFWGEVNVELSYVDSLGWFIEIEKLVQARGGEVSLGEIEEAEHNIRAIFEKIGIDEKCIEERYYIDMLRDSGKE